MRTTLDLPDSLITEAMKLSHQKTKTAVIISALEDFVRKSRSSDLKKYKGIVDLYVALNTLRKRRGAFLSIVRCGSIIVAGRVGLTKSTF